MVEDDTSRPDESGARTWGHSKDHSPDLPQVIIAMAVTRDGIPVRCWTFPGNTGDQPIIRRIKHDLGSWGLRRLVWVADRGFASATNRAYLTRGGGHYIHAEKLRHTNHEAAQALARPGRYKTSPATCGSRKSPSAATGHARNASSCATTPTPPSVTPRCASASWPTCVS